MIRSILLLGGNGFIGQALARKYAELGYKVHIISRNAPTVNHPVIHSHIASLDQASVLERLIPECDLVIHTASTCTPGSSARHPVKEGEENLLPLLRLLEKLSEHPPRQLIYLSSGGTVYGNPKSIPVNENASLRPISYHGAVKAAAELFLEAYAHSSFPVTVLRPSNVYGPGQRGPVSFGIIRTILEQLKSDKPIEIWGEGNSLRDYLYIDDLLSAVIQAHRNQCLGTFNVGTGTGYSLNEILSLAETITKRKAQVIRKPARNMDVESIVLDCRKFREAASWNANTTLEAGMLHTWEWLLTQS